MPYVSSAMDDETTTGQNTRRIKNGSGNIAVPRTAAVIAIMAILILGIEAGALRRFL